ncbi:MAG TPA: molecular chaperone TorD family protein [Dehalococcoidia bacterium]|nr:molecular chaperone TorD family protein [Dehalococcoidia bacterium]
MTSMELQAPEAAQAGNQSKLYSLLSQAFRYPTADLHRSASSGQLAQELSEAAAGLPYAVSVPGGLEVGSLEETQQNHVEMFELGGNAGPPAFIYEGEYGGGRLGVMEDVLRFYDHFGVSPSLEEDTRDRPDHISNELEFMHILSYQEAAALERGSDPGAYRQAQQDFLRFHLVGFTKDTADRTEPKGTPFYSGISALARDLCQQHLHSLRPGG